jgi:transcriptional regulator with XRE-family HTH domain
MAGGAHIPREDLFERTGLTAPERDKLILALRRKGKTQQQIARATGLTQSGVHRAITRLAGEPRRTTAYDMCEACWADVPKDQLNRDGLCQGCSD